MSAKEISQLLAQRAEEVASYLFPEGKREGNEWCIGDICGDPGDSLKIHLTGQKAGVWKDFAKDQKGGDLLDLWCVAGGRNLSISEAIKEAGSYLGINQIQTKIFPERSPNYVKPNVKMSVLSSDSPVMKYLRGERKLSPKTIKDFKISENFSKNGREIIFPYYRDGSLISVKYLNLIRENGKKTIRVQENCEPCLFGWHLIPKNSREITITEGEIDALSLYEYGINALSVPFGGGGGNKQKWIESDYGKLSIFDKINLALDNDAEGQSAAQEIAKRLGGHRCRLVTLPYKDANECLQKNVSKQTVEECFENAMAFAPRELIKASLLVEEVIEQFYPKENTFLGYDPLWKKATGLIKFRPYEISVWSGINGHGKSLFLNQIILGCLQQGARVCIASLELKRGKLLYKLGRQATGLDYPTEGYIRAIHEWYGDNLFIFDRVGTAGSQELLDCFLYAHQCYGVDVFVIDSLLKLEISEDDYKEQKIFMNKLCDFKNEYSCHVHLVIHPKKGIDEKHLPGKMDIKGSGALSDLADNCFSVWRNKEKEAAREELIIHEYELDQKDKEILKTKLLKEADCKWSCYKQRNGDFEGQLGFYFDKKSLQYLEYEKQKLRPFVEYSEIQGKDANSKVFNINMIKENR